MAYTATVLPVMLASPSDVPDERIVARDVLHEWNYVHSLATNIVLMPVGWETHSAPELGARPQELINERVLKDCDLLIGVFWTRLGTPTGEAESGSVEEIKRHYQAGKPAMIYFADKPVAPRSLDQTQYNALQEFKTWCEPKGLVEPYATLDQFRSKLSRQLQIILNSNPYLRELLNRPSLTDTQAGAYPAPHDEHLTDTARDLLSEASKDPAGRIMKISVAGGRFMQSNGKKLGLSDNKREYMRWEHALSQLLNNGLVVVRGSRGEVFEVTEPGYQIAEALQTAGQSDDLD